MRPDIKEFRERLANITIGPTTLRNQGAPGVVAVARSFLKNLDLERFVIINQSDFFRELDAQTNILCKKFPVDALSWGAARKAINLFLAEAYYHRFVSEAYNLDLIEHFLEVPLDSQVGNALTKEADKQEEKDFPRWPGLKHLKPETSKRYQDFAYRVAEAEGYARVYLDVIIWRPESSASEGNVSALHKGG